MVDFQWGLWDSVTVDHLTTELCLQEIQSCQKVSLGPSFIVSAVLHLHLCIYNYTDKFCLILLNEQLLFCDTLYNHRLWSAVSMDTDPFLASYQRLSLSYCSLNFPRTKRA